MSGLILKKFIEGSYLSIVLNHAFVYRALVQNSMNTQSNTVPVISQCAVIYKDLYEYLAYTQLNNTSCFQTVLF